LEIRNVKIRVKCVASASEDTAEASSQPSIRKTSDTRNGSKMEHSDNDDNKRKEEIAL
jgi:hypothetical protein